MTRENTKRCYLRLFIGASLFASFLALSLVSPGRADEGDWSAWRPFTNDSSISWRAKYKWYAESTQRYYFAYQIRNDYTSEQKIEWGAAGSQQEADSATFDNLHTFSSGEIYTDYVNSISKSQIWLKAHVSQK